MILAQRDPTGFQHLHPVQQADGSWAAEVRLPDVGSYQGAPVHVDPYRRFLQSKHEGRVHTAALIEEVR